MRSSHLHGPEYRTILWHDLTELTWIHLALTHAVGVLVGRFEAFLNEDLAD